MISLVGDNKLSAQLAKRMEATREEKKQTYEELNEVRDRCGKLKNELNDICAKMNEYVSKDELETLITDIRESFELFMNQTPRPKDDETDVKLNTLQMQIEELSNKIDALGLNNIEIVPKKRAIPKLDITKRKN